MSDSIKFEMLQRKCIKPSTPTPPHLKTFKLSLLDQLSPDIHGNITFFFFNHSHSQFSTNSQLLQTSLSQTLTLFYPLAGRLHHHPATAIHCNDHGAFFVEARTTTTLSNLLTNPNFTTLESLIPSTDEQTVAMSNRSMLLVRFTLFGCGGTAVSISLTHKIADFAALITLLKTWTTVCTGATELPVPELAAGAGLFPPREIPVNMSASVSTTATGKFTARRFVFTASKVQELKNRVGTALYDGGGAAFHASRVEVVLALIWRCALLSASRSKSNTAASFRPSALFQAVNLRPRMDPAVPDTAVGNFVWPFAVTVEEESHLELHELVKKMREAMREFLDTKARRFREEGGFGVVMESLNERALVLKKNKDIVVYKCTSWCKFPLLELDFGWGKPVWSCSVNNLVSNTIALMDTKDGGVEACVTLDEEEMDFFQQDEELLHFALLNPGVV